VDGYDHDLVDDDNDDDEDEEKDEIETGGNKSPV